jgi:3-hydroxyisobutyrate dehydrogenase-like beta-hydroxyacid dehydrogenase
MIEVKRVGIVGCGLMGSGVAQVCAQAGYPTLVREPTPELSDLADCALVIEAQEEPLLGGRERWVRCLG